MGVVVSYRSCNSWQLRRRPGIWPQLKGILAPLLSLGVVVCLLQLTVGPSWTWVKGERKEEEEKERVQIRYIQVDLSALPLPLPSLLSPLFLATQSLPPDMAGLFAGMSVSNQSPNVPPNVPLTGPPTAMVPSRQRHTSPQQKRPQHSTAADQTESASPFGDLLGLSSSSPSQLTSTITEVSLSHTEILCVLGRCVFSENMCV